MNATERKAYNWLSEQGYHDIIFHSHSTPDFTTNEKQAFEVKKLNKANQILFTNNQLDTLRGYPNTTILVFNHNKQPITQIPFDVINSGIRKWDGINIRSDDTMRTLSIRLPRELLDRITVLAQKRRWSVNGWMVNTLARESKPKIKS